ncbi:MAG: hypothetical protein ACK4WH_12685 [Phycisphaerales bacterium]
MTIRIVEGTTADYRALAHHHYRATPPATVCRVLRALEADERTAGVLVVSRPALNGPWRQAAWPGEYPARGARRLNEQVRVISRVVVDPRSRGRGVAVAMVRAYLDSPLTVRTEALAAMGRSCGFFERAGMRRVDYAPARRVDDLTRRLREIRVRPWELADPDALMRRLGADEHARLHRALRTYADAHGRTRAVKHADLRTLITSAARSIGARPVAYVAGRPPTHPVNP